VFKMCEGLVKGATVLDVGCGEGYVSRHLMTMGANKIIGVDISERMIECANRHSAKTKDQYYIVGDARELKSTLVKKSNTTNTMVRLTRPCFPCPLSTSLNVYLLLLHSWELNLMLVPSISVLPYVYSVICRFLK